MLNVKTYFATLLLTLSSSRNPNGITSGYTMFDLLLMPMSSPKDFFCF